MRPVPFFSTARSAGRHAAALDRRLDSILDECRFINATQVRELEQRVETLTGAAHAVAVGNGTDALIIALRAAGIGPGDEVIVPCYTFVASATSIAHVGAHPVFVDIEPGGYQLDVGALDAALTPRTAAIMPVHLFTRMADMASITRWAALHGLAVIEDSAEAIGMSQAGRHAGRWGAAGVLSFFPTKTLGAAGDAGMILTDDGELAAACRLLRNHGQDDARPYTWHVPGHNSRMDEIQAAVLLTRLETLEADVARRRQLAAAYDRRLAPLAPAVRTPAWQPGPCEVTVPYVYLIETDRRDELVSHLTSREIGTEIYYPRPLHVQPCFAPGDVRPGAFPRAERAARRALALPLYPDLEDCDVEVVCDAIVAFHDAHPQGDDR